MDTMQSNMKKQLQELKEEEIMLFTAYISKLNTTVFSNKEHQQQYQDHDAATKIQSISHGFIHQKQMITEHTAAVIIQTHFHLAYQQRILYSDNDAFNEWNIDNEYINEKKEDNDHVNTLFSSIVLDIDTITNKYQQLI
eukprot:3773747-Ditylum_brightwellii.AAC.1